MSTNRITGSSLSGRLGRLVVATSAALLLVLGATGCGDDGCEHDGECAGDRECEIATGECVDVGDSGDDNGSDGNGTSDGNNGEDTEYWCCLNGEYYECPDEDSTTQCAFDFDPSDCTRDSTRDSECEDDNDGNGGGGGGNHEPAEGDMGDSCSMDMDCADICYTEGFDSAGYCTAHCDDWTDCPDFWDCDEAEGVTGTICLQD